MATFAEPDLIIPAEIYEAMISHCGEDAARSSCGILAGTPPCAQAIYRIRNIAANPDRYESDPNDMIAAYIDQRERGLAVVAIYHSCRGESDPLPNRWDIAENYYGETPRVIISLGKVIRVRVWKLTACSYEELNLRVMPRDESSGAQGPESYLTRPTVAQSEPVRERQSVLASVFSRTFAWLRPPAGKSIARAEVYPARGGDPMWDASLDSPERRGNTGG